MSRLKLWFIIALILFFAYVAYLFVNSLERPDHIHSRDDVPRNQSGESSRTENSIEELETQLQKASWKKPPKIFPNMEKGGCNWA